MDWMADMMRGVHLDFHMPEFPREAIKNFNAIEHVAELKRANVNVVAVFTKCHFGNAFYNTKIGHKHSGLETDYFGDVLEEAHKQGIKVLAYYSLGTDEHAVTHNPDWYQIDENGNKRDGNGTVWHMPCINSPYKEELAIPQIKEFTEKYDIDGVYIDIPYIVHHTCFCRSCKKKFKQEYGRELTRDLLEENREMVVSFGQKSAARCLKEIRHAVKEIKNVPIFINGAWKMGEPEIVNQQSDIGVWESQPANGSYLYTSMKSRYARQLDRPMLIQTVRFTEGWGLMSCKTAEQLKYESATIMANGGIVNIGDQVMPDGTLQKGAYDILKEVFEFVEQREEYAVRQRSIPHIALIANYTSQRYWDNGDFATLGASKMLIEGHQQFDIYYNDQFKNLDNYKVVILPETVRLNEKSIEQIIDFVHRGGLLLASQNAVLQFNEPVRSDLFGVEFHEYSTYSFTYMTEHADLWKGTAAIPQLVDGEVLKMFPATAEILSKIQWPCGESVPPRAFRHPMPPPGDVSIFPAISLNHYGKGKAIFFAAPIFESYWNTNHFWVKNIFNNCLDFYDDSKPYELDGFPTLEVNLAEKNGKQYLHLINYQSSHMGNRQQSIYEPIEQINPVHDVKITWNGSVDKVLLLPERKELSFTVQENKVEITIPRIHIYSILELS
ncbi:alpha-L-fucosidase [Alkalihalobacillus oceani]|uniref:Alpha-L-fucosidase n=1 Tax=Halalkalibacter oceani TaxID=1653776 RepID=A0A9X2DLJ5_9BACI|nr:alpha-amylase family protein [Halalkalibacter oceani]MCM3712976.1 alpha-L-fucosidase [Halalkalibacter oceani]